METSLWPLKAKAADGITKDWVPLFVCAVVNFEAIEDLTAGSSHSHVFSASSS